MSEILPKSNDLIKNSIETNLDLLGNKVDSKYGYINFEQEGDKFILKVNGAKLELPLEGGDKLSEIAKLTDKIIGIYKKEGYSDELYVSESNISKGGRKGHAIMDISVNNRGVDLINTMFLAENGFKKVFGINPDRDAKTMKAYVSFLNKAIQNGNSKGMVASID